MPITSGVLGVNKTEDLRQQTMKRSKTVSNIEGLIVMISFLFSDSEEVFHP